MAYRIKVQDGIISLASTDVTQDANVSVNGQMTVTTLSQANGEVTTNSGQNLYITTGTGGNLVLQPNADIYFNNVKWPTGEQAITSGSFLGSSASNILKFYPFVLGTSGSDTLTTSDLNTAYPNAAVGQFVTGLTVIYQCVAAATWRKLGPPPTVIIPTGFTTSRNTGLGINVAPTLSSGQDNTGLGYNTLNTLTTSSMNTAVGSSAMPAILAGSENTAIGYNSSLTLTSGTLNTSVGVNSMRSNNSGSANTAIGYQSMYTSTAATTTANGNTAVGYNSLFSLTTGVNNTGIGNAAEAATATSNNSVTLGNSAITVLRCAVTSITAISDARDKTDVQNLSVGLDFINDLRPVSFTWNTRDGAKIGTKSSGFLAQELLTAQENANVKDILHLVYDENPDKLEASYSNLLPVLVKAIQELSSQVELLKSQIVNP